jgi:S-adenosylmethionine synthetase
MTDRHVFTSESVTEGHPDKICDQVSDAVLDTILEDDPEGRVACETLATTGMLFLTGEITTDAQVEYRDVARDVLREIGYTESAYGIESETCAVVTSIEEQSGDIAQGVDADGAGDQGLMFGYAVDQTPELMPLPIQLSHRLTRRLAEVRRDGTLPYLGPDGKSQVTVEFADDEPERVDAVVLAAQHPDEGDVEKVREDLTEHVIEEVIPADLRDGDTETFINYTGTFVKGGPYADAGLTGRKTIVDSYGGWAPHGGGAFSGKDPTKVDRSATYGARWAAKNVVDAGLAGECEIQLAYSIGHDEPVSVRVETNGSNVVAEEEIAAAVEEVFDFRPRSLIDDLDLRTPRYRDVAAYGHFGRPDLDLPWERTNRADELRARAGKS